MRNDIVRRSRRDGFTLVEMLIALTVFGIVITIVMSFLGSTMRAFADGSRRVDSANTLLFVTGALQRDLRTVGTNVPVGQPSLVYAGRDVVVYNADYVSNVGDPFAVIQDPNAPAGQVSALAKAVAITIPGTAVTYPDTNYVNSPAETIMYYFRPDSSTAREDDLVLFRRVNAAAPEVVSENIVRMPDRPLLEYLRLVPDSTGTRLGQVPNDSLPLFHSAPIHLSAADSGRFAVIDSIRGVRFNLGVTNGRTGADEQVLLHSSTVWLRNTGHTVQRTCGSPPIYNGGLTATLRAETGKWVIDLTWNAAVDETGGEEDVLRYVIWRRLITEPASPDPYLSIPGGDASYTYTDRAVELGQTLEYTIAAQDCTPSLSTKVSAVVVVPSTAP